MIDNAGAHNYTYDTLDRITAATHPNQANESYTLDDATGTVTFTYNSLGPGEKLYAAFPGRRTKFD